MYTTYKVIRRRRKNMPRYKPPTIANTGLSNYLDSTRVEHNGFSYVEFTKMVDNKLNASNIARAFGVDRRTIIKWVVILEKELAEND
jgi:hypothetical protein